MTSKSQAIRAALIDMDGTLYDSMPSHARAWMQMIGETGLDAREEEFFKWEGMTGAAIIDKLMRRSRGRAATEAECRDLYALKAKYFQSMPPVEPIAGAQRLVEALRERDIITVLVTGSGQASLLTRLERDFPGAFPADRRVTSASVSHGKPHPEPFLKGAALAGVAPSHCVGIDNAPLGTRSAHDAGMLTVGVITGPLASTDLSDAGAHIVYNSMVECADLLPELLSKIDNPAR